MRRKLFTLAAGVSAVGCGGVCVLWWRSYRVTDELRWTDTRRQGVAESWGGRFIVRGAFDMALGAFAWVGGVAPPDRFRPAVHLAGGTKMSVTWGGHQRP